MKKLAFFSSTLSFLIVVFLAMVALPATPEAPSPDQTKPQQGPPQPQTYSEEMLKKMKISDLKDTDILEISGRTMSGKQFKIRIRRELKVKDPADPTEVARALNLLYNTQKYELKPTYDESELSRMMEDLIEVASRERPRKQPVKPSGLTGNDLGKPFLPPMAQKPPKFPESIRPDRPKREKAQTQDGEELIDLRLKVISLQKNGELKEGDNLIHTTPSGLKFTARVEGDRIISWKITDNQDREVKEADSSCWSCREADGKTECFRVSCPKK